MGKEITFSSNVNDNGKFYAEIPRESEYKVNGRVRFGGHEYHVFKGVFDLKENSGSGVYISTFGAVSEGGCEYPIEPDARNIDADPDCISDPVLELNLQQANITSIIWATGYANDFSWLNVDVFDHEGKPKHLRGVSDESGIYFLGLPWLSRRGSSFIWGVWHDAKYLADHIVTQHRYLHHHSSSPTT